MHDRWGGWGSGVGGGMGAGEKRAEGEGGTKCFHLGRRGDAIFVLREGGSRVDFNLRRGKSSRWSSIWEVK